MLLMCVFLYDEKKREGFVSEWSRGIIILKRIVL